MATPGKQPAPEPVLERFQIAKGGSLLLLPVRLKEKRLLFALDTGASCSVYDSSLIPLLGKPLREDEVGTSDGVTRVRFFRSPDAMLGRLTLRTDSPVIAVDLGSVREATGEDVYGFIGMDSLARYVIRIDPDHGEIVFLQTPGPDPGQRLPLGSENQLPCVLIRLSGLDEPQRFIVDTGCVPGGGTGLMQSQIFNTLVAQRKIEGVGVTSGQSLSAVAERQRGTVEEISLAGYRHANLIFSASVRNILGLNYWLRYSVTFDFPRGELYLKKSRMFDEPDTQDLSGLTFNRTHGETVVVSVEKKSPAASAGILRHDVILKANGEDVESMPLLNLRRLLAAKGRNVTLVLSTRGEQREVTLVLKDWEHR
jgi:hypothetical protein